MKNIFLLLLLCRFLPAFADNTIHVNQVAFEKKGPKIAIVETDGPSITTGVFLLIDAQSGATVTTLPLGKPQQVPEWGSNRYFYPADFSRFEKAGTYKIKVNDLLSDAFAIGEHALTSLAIPAILHYYNKQKANTPEEWAADAHAQLFGSNQTVDLRGGWCDASGDVSKYFSHLAYANFMSPQQIPLVTWSLLSARERIPHLLTQWGVKDSIENEACWGADYILRDLSDSGYFYMTLFTYFKKDPKERRVVGLLANSVTTNDYQCAFREGGGMGIAALARASRLKVHGDFTNAQYLAGAERAFAHLLVNNTRYDDDHKENIIDDYCALMAATELWIATGKPLYRDEARKRAQHLHGRMSEAGYFIANDADRPFWHASDAGMPVVALARYLDKEQDVAARAAALGTIRKALDYNLRVSANVSNPFGYARQSFLFKGAVKDGFFIPHENETGWWWQGENARLGSLATAAIVGGRLVYPGKGAFGVTPALATYAAQQVSWILGCNPYNLCFMYQFGSKNVPYMQANYGHGSERGGVSNGITGKDGNPDGSGIDFKTEAEGNEWRWTEQWIPHAAWLLQALAAMADVPEK
ncbi:N-terminal ig-like domain of cellulase [Chitinophaga costaii]|uniref:N-terminal ig-like domain of cellulase n=1 Tax=Chitinophaga costaii TaxID=1335309 RepID=A0A1C4CKC9_9BACT|nr:glycoside hydrolase family 9 protein [Chitinophaga costaii]PUZ27055.1 glycosyl transferase [Chitinophaga costaii]SCC19498.1 N-terminal ig-like domain of cellulase [Chitinophaga costaii]